MIIENICPNCASKNVSFGNYELSNDYKFNTCSCKCEECHFKFQQVYALEYLETELYTDDDIIYSSNEGMCPLCGSQKLTYDGCELDENQKINYISCHCSNCANTDPNDENSNFDFQQVYGLNFLKTAICFSIATVE